jgi:hypothetical protein
MLGVKAGSECRKPFRRPLREPLLEVLESL